MLGADTFVSAILRTVTSIAILAAVYFLIVKPVLNTTTDAVHNASRQANHQQRVSELASQKAELSGARQRAVSYAQSALTGSQPWFAASREIRRCVKDAGSSLPKMNRCANEGESIVSRVLSPRNIATSYANSVASQGNSAGAEEIRTCIKDAGFKVGPMLHCQARANKLLYG